MKKEKILLVDDEAGIRKVLGITLSDIGYEVFTAENGEAALQTFRNTTPSIVLTDIKMPGMDGLELLRKIKGESPDTEVIMITGHGDMDLAIESLKYEATDFVTKPIDNDILDIALKRAHDKISMREQLREYTENLESLVREKSAKLVEAERLAALGQAVEELSTAIWHIAGDVEGGLRYFNEIPCFVSIHNRDQKIVATNELYRERLGDRIGANSWEIYRKRAASKGKCPVGKTLETGKGQRSRGTIYNIKGNDIPVIVHTAPIRNRDGDIELVLEMSVDVTEVKRLQEELRTTQKRYEQLFDEVPCYISVLDKDFRLTGTNKQFKEDFGNDIGSPCHEIYKHRGRPCPNCPAEKTFEDGKSHHSEMVVTSKTGEQYNVLIWTAPIRNAAGEITQVMEMSTNITQIRQLQDHLSSLGLLIGSISHGIKGLLTGLDGGIYTLHSGFTQGNEEEIKEGWETVKLMVDRIKSMVLNILYYAKERDLKWESVDALTFANDVASVLDPKLREHDIQFIRDFDHSVGEFEVDASVLRSALVNILENAIDACIEDKAKDAHQIVLGVTQDQDHVIFNVHDNGIGMDRDTRENLFTLFFSSKGHKGTGLGLFVSNKTIEQHGGSIKVESTPGEGSHFSISMPKRLQETVKTPAPRDM